MTNTFEVSKLNTNTMIIGYDSNKFNLEEAMKMQTSIQKALPHITVVLSPLVQGAYMVSETL